MRLITLDRPAKMNSLDFAANDAPVEREFKPVVAAVNGYAVSGGLGPAPACDVRFCAEDFAGVGDAARPTLAGTGRARTRTAQAASLRRESSTRTCCGASIVRTMSRPLYDCTSKNWRT